MNRRLELIAAVLTIAASPVFAATLRAGTARANITPELPIWLSGYAKRTHPSTHVMLDLWAKALALKDGRRGRVVIVTTDLIGLPHEITDEVAAKCAEQFGLKRSQLWLNSSHTHSGPAVWPNLRVMFDLTAEDAERSRQYAQKLVSQLVGIVGKAITQLSPVSVE